MNCVEKLRKADKASEILAIAEDYGIPLGEETEKRLYKICIEYYEQRSS